MTKNEIAFGVLGLVLGGLLGLGMGVEYRLNQTKKAVEVAQDLEKTAEVATETTKLCVDYLKACLSNCSGQAIKARSR